MTETVVMCKVLHIHIDISYSYVDSNNEVYSVNKINPGYFSLAATALKQQQLPMFLHISTTVWGHR